MALLAGTLACIGVAIASAGHPVKGGIYEGIFGGSCSNGCGADESLTVTSNGRRLASVAVLPAECGTPPGPVATVHNVAIVNGAFKVTYPGVHTRPGIFDTAILTGHFLSHGRAAGREDVRSNETFNGSLCKYSVSWTATAQPAGTKPCPNHAPASRILVNGTTCVVVNQALDKGTFAPATPPAFQRTFSTPGWTCRLLTGGVQTDECSRAQPKAMFSFVG